MYEVKHLGGGACYAALFSGELLLPALNAFFFSGSLGNIFPKYHGKAGQTDDGQIGFSMH